jgi:hypothetical protein
MKLAGEGKCARNYCGVEIRNYSLYSTVRAEKKIDFSTDFQKKIRNLYPEI